MIKIYCARIDEIDTVFLFERLLEQVNTQRREKILRCHNEKDKLRSLVAGLLLRYALEQEGFIYGETKISISEMGKPFLCSKKPVYFSISHTENIAICAIAETDLGIDVECASRMKKQYEKPEKRRSFIDKIATPFEKEYMSRLDDVDYTEGLLKLWTGKESYGKKKGLGIQIKMNECQVLEMNQIYADWLDEKKEYFFSVCSETSLENKPEIQWISVAQEYSK